MQRWARLLRARGLKITAPRVAIAKAMLARPRHATPQQLHAELAKQIPGLSLNTVYQVLHQFEQAGLLRALALGRRIWFDSNLSPHAHLVCQRCGRIEDVLVALDELLRKEGWAIARVQLVAEGICADCRGS